MVLVAGGTLEGKVTLEPSGEAVADVTVRAQSWNGFSSRIAEAETDAEGRYVIDTLLEGNVNSITVEKEGYVQVREPGQQQWQQVPLNRGDTVVRDIKLRRAAILSGKVTGPGGPIAGASVTAYVNAGMAGFQNKSAKTDGSGEYRFDGMDAGKAILVVSAKGHYQRDMPQQWWQALQQGTAPEEFSVEIPETGEITKDIVLAAGVVLTGRVETAEGSPVKGASVRGTSGTQSVSAKTADDGTFRLEGVQPAPQASVYVTADGYAAASKQVAVSEESEPEDVVVEMVRTGKVRGTIRGAGSGDLIDAYVQIATHKQSQANRWPPQSPEARWANVQRAPVLADGTYEIEMTLAAGKFVVRASALDFQATLSEPQTVVPGQEWYEVDIVLGEGGSLHGRVTDAETGTPLSGALVRLGSAAQQQMYWAGMNQMNRIHPIVAVTGEDGTYRVEHVATGAYNVSAQAEGYVDKTQKAAVPSKGAVDLKVQPELEIRGVVKMKDGSPVQGAQVVANKAGGNQQNYGWNPNQSISGSDGSFRVGGLAKGNYSLHISPPWNSTLNIKPHTHGPVAAGADGVEVEVEGGLAIAGEVVTPEGEPAPTVWVSAQPETGQGGMWRNGQTDNKGTFRILGLKEGTYTLHVQTNWSGASQYQAKQMKGIRAGTEDVRIQLAAGYEIEGRVADDQNKPVANLQINAQRIQVPGEDQVFSGWANTSTDADGKFTLRGLSQGNYRLNGQGGNTGMVVPGQSGASGRVLLGGASVAAGTKGLRLTYAEGSTIEGTVTDRSGKPVKAAGVNAKAKGQQWSNTSGATDENGHFVIKGLQPDVEYTLTVTHSSHKQASVEAVLAGTGGVSVELEAGLKITGTLLDADGNALGQKPLMFTLQKEGGATGGNSMASTRKDGTFEKGGLDEGTYKVQMWQMDTSEGMRTGKWVELGEVDAPAEDVTLRVPASD